MADTSAAVGLCVADQSSKGENEEAMGPRGADSMPKEPVEEECEPEEEGFEIPVIWIGTEGTVIERGSREVELCDDDDDDDDDDVTELCDDEGDDAAPAVLDGNLKQEEVTETAENLIDGIKSLKKELSNENTTMPPPPVSHSDDEQLDPSDEEDDEQVKPQPEPVQCATPPPSVPTDSSALLSNTASEESDDDQSSNDRDFENEYPWVSAFATSVLGGLLDDTDSSTQSHEKTVPPPPVPETNIEQIRRKSKMKLFIRRIFGSKAAKETQKELDEETDSVTVEGVAHGSDGIAPPIIQETTKQSTARRFSARLVRGVSATRLFGTKSSTFSHKDLDKNAGKESEHTVPKVQKFTRRLSVSTRRLLGSNKPKDEPSIQTRCSSSECSTNSQEIEDGSISDSSSLDNKSVVSRLSALVAERTEEMEVELIEMIDDVLFEFDNDEVEKELLRHRDTSLKPELVEGIEEELAKLVDQIDGLKSCGAANCVVGCLRDDSLSETGDDVTAASSTNDGGTDIDSGSRDSDVLIDTREMAKGSKGSTSLDRRTPSIADALFDSESLEDDDTMMLEGRAGDCYSGKLNDFQDAIDGLRRCAACQGIGDALLLERVRTQTSKRETLSRVRHQ